MKPNKKQGRKRKIFISVMLIFRLLFGGTQAASASSNSKKVQDEVGSKAGIFRTLSRESSMIANLNQDDCPQSELIPEGAQRIIRTPSGYIISSILRVGENDLSSALAQKPKVLLKEILLDDKQEKTLLVDNQVEVFLLTPFQ